MQDESASSTWRHVVLAGLRRTATVLLVLSAAAAGLAVVCMWIWDMSASRAFPLAFFVGGSVITIGGFLGATMGPTPVAFPQGGALIRERGYFSARERQRAQGNAVLYGAFGILLILIGAGLDAYL